MLSALWSLELLVVVALATWRYVRTMDELVAFDAAAALRPARR